ncbi:MAG: nucleotide exchange factor GrpE [Ignavibacteriaceae bacterium]
MTKKNHDKETKEKDAQQNEEKKNKSTEEMDELSKRVEELEKEVEENKDKILRKAAEFENYKRRTENDQLNLLKYTGETLIMKLLPAIDDFERSMQHMDDAKDVKSIKEGLQLVYNKLMKILNEQGVKKIEAVGKPFDVDYHEALMQRKDESVPPHTVLDELEKGYMYKDKVVRHSKVIVSEETAEETEAKEENSENETKNEG